MKAVKEKLLRQERFSQDGSLPEAERRAQRRAWVRLRRLVAEVERLLAVRTRRFANPPRTR